MSSNRGGGRQCHHCAEDE
jgi:hypothetical protein